MDRVQPYVEALGVAFCILVGITGCSRGGPVVVPVHGTVTHHGIPLKNGGITFMPADGRSAFGRIVDGQIVEVTTMKKGDGVIVGMARVGIQATTNLGEIQGPHTPLIPQRYFDPVTANLTVEIKTDGPNELKLDLVD